MSIPWSFSYKPSLCRSSVTSSLWIPWGRLVQNRCWFLISSVVNGPIILSCFFRREFRMNLAVQATILNIEARSWHSGAIKTFFGNFSLCLALRSATCHDVCRPLFSVWKPFHSLPPQLAVIYLPSSTSQVCRNFVSGYVAPSNPWMLLCFHRSVCYELFVLAATVYPMESHWAIQPSIAPLTGNPSSAFSTFMIRFVAICADTSSNRGMVSICFASRAFAVTKPWLTPDGCLATAWTVAHTPFLLASPNT